MYCIDHPDCKGLASWVQKVSKNYELYECNECGETFYYGPEGQTRVRQTTLEGDLL